MDQWDSAETAGCDHVTMGPHPQQDVSRMFLVHSVGPLLTGDVNRDPTRGQDGEPARRTALR